MHRANHHRADASAYNLKACKNEAKEVLQNLVDTIEIGESEASVEKDVGFWDLLNPRVVSLPKSRFVNGLYADAVSACLREINTIVKDYVRSVINQEIDGPSLMTRLFHPKILL